jgi:hypothetical protein
MPTGDTWVFMHGDADGSMVNPDPTRFELVPLEVPNSPTGYFKITPLNGDFVSLGGYFDPESGLSTYVYRIDASDQGVSYWRMKAYHPHTDLRADRFERITPVEVARELLRAAEGQEVMLSRVRVDNFTIVVDSNYDAAGAPSALIMLTNAHFKERRYEGVWIFQVTQAGNILHSKPVDADMQEWTEEGSLAEFLRMLALTHGLIIIEPQKE